MDNRILLRMCRMSGHEMKFIEEAFEGEWVVPLGPNVKGFEEDLERFLGQGKQIVALSSGTAALHLGLLGLGVKEGDEVMVQSMNFSASVNPVRYVGAVPVMVDSEPFTWNIDPDLLDHAIGERIKITGKKPKAIVIVCLYGMPVDYDKVLKIAEKWEIPVLEDAAEAFGSSYQGRRCGTFGRYGVLSFNGNKMITTSGGGALVCPDEETAKKTMYYATQARLGYAYYQHEEVGYNYRMSNISAGIGRGQMMVAEDYIAHHRHRQKYYREHLNIEGIKLHENPDCNFDSNFWLCTALIDPHLKVEGQDEAYSSAITSTVGGAGGVTGQGSSIHTDCEPNSNVEALRVGLSRHGIETRPLWKPMHRQPVFAEFPSYVNGVSEGLFHRGICLPSGPYVTDKDADRVISAIRDLIIK